jgi:molybdopterin synthase catalytic subunit
MLEIRSGPLSIDECVDAVRRAGAGGLVTFVGSVRDFSDGQTVEFLEYEAYEPMALEALKRVANEARDRWPVHDIAIQHRIGRLDIGDDAVVVAVSCTHRAEAFDACRYVIDRLKEIVPIWKKEHGERGQTWVGGPTAPATDSSPAREPD